MAIWRVIASPLTILTHPNADKMALGKLGQFQVVIAKSNGYEDGQIIVFAPEKSILPEDLRLHYTNSETGASYLSGKEHDRVSSIRLRGELSMGVTLPPEWVLAKGGWASLTDIPLDTDLSEILGITKYEAPIPLGMSGMLVRIETVADFAEHDVEQFRLYEKEFTVGELVIATEKLHGSQINILRDSEGQCLVTSKGIASRHCSILENESNIYWKAVRNVGLFEALSLVPDVNFQIFGEVIPCQGEYTYGQEKYKPTLRIFRLIVEGSEYSYKFILLERTFMNKLKPVLDVLVNLWVPVIYDGPFDVEKLIEASKGKETVSEKQLHIREGIVVTPIQPRLSSEGFPLIVKIINPKYKESGEEFS